MPTTSSVPLEELAASVRSFTFPLKMTAVDVDWERGVVVATYDPFAWTPEYEVFLGLCCDDVASNGCGMFAGDDLESLMDRHEYGVQGTRRISQIVPDLVRIGVERGDIRDDDVDRLVGVFTTWVGRLTLDRFRRRPIAHQALRQPSDA